MIINKGWKFYNPITKKTIISERAEFDEHYMLGSTLFNNLRKLEMR